jgi:hypothetical protein
MKKLVGLLSLLFLFSLATVASNSKPNTNPHSKLVQQEKQDKTKSTQKHKYDFSLFKFISPIKTNHQNDSLKIDIQDNKTKKRFDETTILYEKPRAFLMFS